MVRRVGERRGFHERDESLRSRRSYFEPEVLRAPCLIAKPHAHAHPDVHSSPYPDAHCHTHGGADAHAHSDSNPDP
jgi:hypothetical protein